MAPLRLVPSALGVLAIATAPIWAESTFIYTNNDVISGNTVSAFAAGPGGALAEIAGSPFRTGGNGAGGGGYAVGRIAVAGSFLFASNGGSQTIAVFAIDPATGALAAVPGSPFRAGAAGGYGDISLAAAPDATLLFAAQSSGAVTSFRVAADGRLAPSGAPVPAGGVPAGMKVTPDGKFLAIAIPGASPWSGVVAVFAIAADGALAPVPGSPFNAAGFAAGIEINCAGNRLYSADMNFSGATMIDIFTIAGNGALRAAGPPFIAPSGRNSNVALLSPDDRLLFASNQDSQTVTAMTVNPAGGLALVPGSPFAVGGAATYPSGMAMDAAGKYLYVAANPNLIGAFRIGGGSTLAAVPGAPFTTGQPAGLLSLAAWPPKACAPPVLPVALDIKPGGAPNTVNPKSRGAIPVAILSTDDFTAPARVHAASLTFGRTGDEPSLRFCNGGGEDVNADGLPDLVCHFDTERTAFRSGDGQGVLKGKTLDGQPIQGADGVDVVR
jgi:6-phosphogluconolactonase (cycloisomerase 2 family)